MRLNQLGSSIAMIGLGLGVSVLAAPAANAATVNAADGTAIHQITSSTSSTTQIYEIAHTCAKGTDAGADTDHEGVFCADLDAEVLSDGSVEVWPEAEGSCQMLPESGKFVLCANVTLDYEIADSVGDVDVQQQAECGHLYGVCGTPRYDVYGAGYLVPAGGCANVWSVVLAGSQIELPGSAVDSNLAANLGSGHVYVGSGC